MITVARNKYRRRAVGLGMTHSTILNERDLLDIIVSDEKARRRRRFETQTGAVHQRRNKKDRRVESQQSNTKRGRAWRNEQW